MSEKVGGAEGTKLDDDFKEMERVSLNTAHIYYYHAFFFLGQEFQRFWSWNHSENFETLSSSGLCCQSSISFCFLTKGYVMCGTL